MVTGASGGIGGAIVDSLREAGCTIYSTDLSHVPAREGPNIFHRSGDITNQRVREELVEDCAKRFGRLDILVNNAGVAHRVDFFDTTEAMYDQTMDVNLKSYFFLSQAAARVMREQDKGGSIVNMASIAADVTHSNTAAYSISKGGVRTLTYTLAVALSPLRVRVNALAPGTIVTNINRSRWETPGIKERAIAGVPIRRLGAPTDIGPAIVYLASDQASFMTGSVVVIDGGRSHITI
jgi:NAD(P)-dependent dehydrogenase (short-subunit alcohol dehydrogenase family)